MTLPGPAIASRIERRAAQVAPPLAVWVVLVILLFLRNPSFLLRAEFWGEDGWAWFPQAYTDGWSSLFHPVAGYLQTVPRLAGLVAQALPMAWAPTLFTAVALAIEAIPPAFLASARMQRAWPHPVARLAFALVWVALPNIAEVYANLTNTQWHLAALAFLVLLADAPATRRAAVFDGVTLVVSGLSGPFCLLLLPVAGWLAVRRHDRAAILRAAIVLALVLLQGTMLLLTASARSAAPLGASLPAFIRIVAQQVLLAPLIGQSHMAWLQGLPVWQAGILPAAVLATGLALGVLAVWRGPDILRLACALAVLTFTSALLQPQVRADGEQWHDLLIPGGGQRYDLFPMLAWLGVLLWAGTRRAAPAHVAGAAVAVMVCFGIWSDWSIPGRHRTNFRDQAAAFERLPPGAAMAFPINPYMDRMPMILIHR